MSCRKSTLELIPNEKARRITYDKRKKGMMKKAQEFATLCDVDTCVILCGATGSTAATEPEIWPASPEKVKRIVERYMSEEVNHRAKRTVGLPKLLASQKRKVDAELTKARMMNWEAKYPISEALIEGLSEDHLRRLLGALGHKLEAAKARPTVMKEGAMRRLSHTYDHQVHADDHIYDHHQMQGLFQDHCLFEDILPMQNFHFATPEGTMLSDMAC